MVHSHSCDGATGAIVVKLGGSTLGAHDTSLSDCVALHREGRRVVIVHGGGATVSDWLRRLDVPAEWLDGLRKTTAESRDVVVAVLAGLVNTTLVQQLNRLGARAVGLTGADAGMICSPPSPRGLGLVGETPRANPAPLRAVLDAGMLPVVAPIGLTPDSAELLNVNADAAAGAIATALPAEHVIFLSDVAGILDAGGALAPELDAARASAWRESGVISGGMLPKVEAGHQAAAAGASARIVDGREAGAIPAALAGSGGTLVQ
jgi:acetylglutamate kinase